MTDDLDRSTRPGKWIKRGPMPEVPTAQPSPTVAVAALLAEIREETCPIRKQELEDAFKAHCEAYDAINPESLPADPKPLYSEIIGVIPVDIDLTEGMTQEGWTEIHQRILACKRHAGKWASKSRKFAANKWGIDFVAESEAQMELALGIEAKTGPEPCDEPREVVAANGLVRAYERGYGKDADLAGWDAARAGRVLELMGPIEGFLVRLRGIVTGN